MIVIDERAGISADDLTPGFGAQLRSAVQWLPIFNYADGYGLTYGIRTVGVRVSSVTMPPWSEYCSARWFFLLHPAANTIAMHTIIRLPVITTFTESFPLAPLRGALLRQV